MLLYLLLCFAATAKSKRSTTGRGAIKPCQKLRKWVALRENYFDVWCSRNIRANRITNAQWWTRILSRSLFFDTPPKKRENKTKFRSGLCADRVRSCGGNVGGYAIKTFPRLIYCKYFLQYEKRWERKRGSLISEIVIARVALLHIFPVVLFTSTREGIHYSIGDLKRRHARRETTFMTEKSK